MQEQQILGEKNDLLKEADKYGALANKAHEQKSRKVEIYYIRQSINMIREYLKK